MGKNRGWKTFAQRVRSETIGTISENIDGEKGGVDMVSLVNAGVFPRGYYYNWSEDECKNIW